MDSSMIQRRVTQTHSKYRGLIRFARISIIALIVLVAVLPFSAHRDTVRAQGANGQYRFFHGVPQAGAVDVLIDGQIAARGVEPGQGTRYFIVPEGEHTISVNAAGTTTELSQQTDTIEAANAKTVIASGRQAVVFTIVTDELGPISLGKTRFSAIHVVTGGGNIDVIQSDAVLGDFTLLSDLAYNTPSGSVDVEAVTGILAIAAPGSTAEEALVRLENVPLIAGTHNLLISFGDVEGDPAAQLAVLTAPIRGEADTGAARFVHGNADAPAVDLYVNDTLIAATIEYGNFTEHIALSAGPAKLDVRAAGAAASDAPLATTEFNVEASAAQTLIVAGTGEAPAFVVSADDISALDPLTARLNLINATTDADGLAIFGPNPGVPYDAIGQIVNLESGIYDVAVSTSELLNYTSPLTLNGGVLYDLIAVGTTQENARLLIAPTGLNERPGSAPTQVFTRDQATLAATSEAAIEATVQVTTEATVESAVTLESTVEATEAATVESTAEDTTETTVEAPTEATAEGAAIFTFTPTNAPIEVAAPTLNIDTIVQTSVAQTLTAIVPTQTAVPIQATTSIDTAVSTPAAVTIVTATPAIANPVTVSSTGISGTVTTDPGVNLKLRNRPNVDASTIGLVPSGTVLTILGVEGPAEAAVADVTTTPTATLEGTTVVPGVETLWIFVSWAQPDGGTITGWTRPQYLTINRNGTLVFTAADILSFPKIPTDRLGEVNTSGATPIANIIPGVSGVVVVDPGVRLQVRRTPSQDGESLALLEAGITVEVLGYVSLNAGTPTIAPSLQTGTQTATPTPEILWYYIRFNSEAGSVTGYVNSVYLTISQNGQRVELADLTQITNPEPGTQTGSIAPPTQVPAAGLVAVVDKLNAGANLQLRRTPSAEAESLGLIPANTNLVVTGRNGDGNWLRVNYNGIEGWISSQFVTVRLNGRITAIADIDNVTADSDLTGSFTPGPSPTATVLATVTP